MEENEKKIRTFIALELSDKVKKELARVTGELEKTSDNIKWVNPETIHLTLKFLGGIDEGKIEEVKIKLAELARKTGKFDVTLGTLGVFPDWKYVKVIWVGLEEGREESEKLASLVGDAMEEAGFEKEKRPFKSHLTLGRVKSSKGKEGLKKQAESIQVAPARTHIERITLFKSDLTEGGAVHTPLAEFDLT